METSRWVDEKLMKLEIERSWQPNGVRALNRIRDQREHAGTKTSKWIWASGGLLAGALGTLAFPAPRATAQRVLAPCIGACESFFAGKDTRASLTSNGPPEVGDVAPNLSFIGEGSTMRLSDFRGRVVLLNFWATWCPPCRTEIPWFVEFERNFGRRGFSVVGVSMDERGWKAVRPFREAQGIQYALGIGGAALAEKFGVDSIPTTLLIDADGKIRAKYTGITDRSEYEKAIQKLLSR